jgi:hypothetical protein
MRRVLLAVVDKIPENTACTVARDALLTALRHRLQSTYPDLRALDDVMRDLPSGIDGTAVKRLLDSAGTPPVVTAEDKVADDGAPWLRMLEEDMGSVPRYFPYVDDGHVELGSDGNYRYVTSHLGMPREEPKFSWPLLTDFRVAGRLELGTVHATVVTDCMALGGCIYRHIAYIFFGGGAAPDLIVAAETNEPETTAAAKNGTELLYYLGLFTRRERRNLGYVVGLDDLDRFIDVVAALTIQIGGLPQDVERTWLSADDRLVDMQAELASTPGEPSQARLSAQLRLLSHILSGVDQKLAYDGCRNAAQLALGVGDLDTALAVSRTALAIDLRSAVTCQTDEYEIPAVDVLRHGQLLFRLMEAGRINDAVGLAHDSFRLCMTPRPRRVRTGLASHVLPVDDDIEDELLTIGMAEMLADSGSAVEIIRTASRRSRLSFHTAGIGAAEALLGICLAEQGNTQAAMESSARAVECALLLEDAALIQTAVAAAILASFYGGNAHIESSYARTSRRTALEESLVRSYGAISDRLVVSNLLAGIPPTEGTATQLFDAMTARHGFLKTEDPLPDSREAWLEKLAYAAAAGQCPPIGQDDLASLMISTPEGDFHWSDFAAVNNALMEVNSSLRLMTFASLENIIDRAAAIVGVTTATRPTDTGFILGEVGPVTATPLAPLLDFCREYAISPALPQREVGFVFENIIVLRRSNMPLSDDDYAVIAKGEWPTTWLGAFIHESVHVRAFMNSRRYSFLRADWFRYVMSDVLRLCDMGIDPAAIAKRLAPNFDNILIWSDTLPLEDAQVFQDVDIHKFLRRWSLQQLLTMMTADGLIATVDGQLRNMVSAR